MAYTNSSMVVYKKLSPNHSGQRTHSIDRITPHCVVGQCTAEGLEDVCSRTVLEDELSHLLDYLLDFACDEKILGLYKRV